MSISRRYFLGQALGFTAGPLVLHGRSEGPALPSNTIHVGVIGLGTCGSRHLQALLRMEGVRVVGVCDVARSKTQHWKAQVDRAQKDPSCMATQDADELSAHPGMDAVFVASTENWHALHAIQAMRSGKDVYVEMGLALTIREGYEMTRSARRLGRIFQADLPPRTQSPFRHGVELVRNGYLGRIQKIEISVPGGRPHILRQQQCKPSDPPGDLDYDRWLGPAPWSPYDELKCSAFHWPFMRDYSAGWIQMWGGILWDIAQWACPQLSQGQIEVEGEGRDAGAGRADVISSWRVRYTASDGLVVDFKDDETAGFEHGIRFVGDEGRVHITRDGLKAWPETLEEQIFKPVDQRMTQTPNLYVNFFDSMRSRRDPIALAEEGHKANTLALLADIAARLRRRVVFDWDREGFVHDAMANRMTGRVYRAPYLL